MRAIIDFLVQDVLTYVGYLFTVIGFIATVCGTIYKCRNYRKISWGKVEKYTLKIIKEMQGKYKPDCIVGIGRGGAVFSGLLSVNMKSAGSDRYNIPLYVFDRKYITENGEVKPDDSQTYDFSALSGKKVLLVTGDVINGKTMPFFYEKINAVAKCVKTATLIIGKNSAATVDYSGKVLQGGYMLPWQLNKNYTKDSVAQTKKKIKKKTK